MKVRIQSIIKFLILTYIKLVYRIYEGRWLFKYHFKTEMVYQVEIKRIDITFISDLNFLIEFTTGGVVLSYDEIMKLLKNQSDFEYLYQQQIKRVRK